MLHVNGQRTHVVFGRKAGENEEAANSLNEKSSIWGLILSCFSIYCH